MDGNDLSEILSKNEIGSSAKDLEANNSAYGIALKKKIWEWLENFPDSTEKKVLEAQLKSSLEKDFHGAFLELVSHRLLFALGYNCECHPSLSGIDTVPDFIAKNINTNERIYLEATVNHYAGVFSGRLAGSMEKVLTKFTNIESSNFDLEIKEFGFLNEYPKSIDDFVANLRDEIKVIPRDIVANFEGETEDNRRCRLEFKYCGWELKVFLKIQNQNNKSGIAKVTFIPDNLGFNIRTTDKIRYALKLKAVKYGEFEFPFVIVLNTMDVAVENDELIDALFGNRAIAPGIVFRESNGLWTSLKDPLFRGVSAALIFRNLRPSNMRDIDAILFSNPFANKPLVPESPLHNLPQIEMIDEQIKFVGGTGVSQIIETTELPLF